MIPEDAVREQLINLLRYANKTAVGEALGVSAQTVINWSEGKHPSQTRLDQIRALYGLPVASPGTTKEAAEPEWVQRLEDRLIELRENQDRVAQEAAAGVVTALTPPVREQWAARIEARLADIPTQSDEAPAGSPDTEGLGDEVPQGPKRG